MHQKKFAQVQERELEHFRAIRNLGEALTYKWYEYHCLLPLHPHLSLTVLPAKLTHHHVQTATLCLPELYSQIKFHLNSGQGPLFPQL